MAPALGTAIVSCAMAADDTALKGIAGIDRVAVLPGKTYLRGWAGFGDLPKRGWSGQLVPAPTAGPGAPEIVWTKESGPGKVTFADPKSLSTTAAFSVPGAYVLRLSATAAGFDRLDQGRSIAHWPLRPGGRLHNRTARHEKRPSRSISGWGVVHTEPPAASFLPECRLRQ